MGQPPGPVGQPPGPMGQPPPQAYAWAPVQQPVGTNGLAVASLVLGILWLYWIGSLLATIFGAVAIRQIDARGGMQGGKGLAVAGLVLGIVGLGILAIILVSGAALFGVSSD